jgi:hypothetical protein
MPYLSRMSIVTTPRTEAEVDKIVATVKKVTKELIRNKAKGRAFLVKHGYLTKKGKLTKRYGG